MTPSTSCKVPNSKFCSKFLVIIIFCCPLNLTWFCETNENEKQPQTGKKRKRNGKGKGKGKGKKASPKRQVASKGKAAPKRKCKTSKVLDMDAAEGEDFSLIKIKDSTIVGSCRVSAMFAWWRSSLAIFDKFSCSFVHFAFWFAVIGAHTSAMSPYRIAFNEANTKKHLFFPPGMETCCRKVLERELHIFSQNSVNNFP